MGSKIQKMGNGYYIPNANKKKILVKEGSVHDFSIFDYVNNEWNKLNKAKIIKYMKRGSTVVVILRTNVYHDILLKNIKIYD
jgi:hypothetical protein